MTDERLPVPAEVGHDGAGALVLAEPTAPAQAGGGATSLGRRLLWLFPALALAYPLLIQPLSKYQPVEAYSELDLLTNVKNAESSPVNQAFWVLLLGAACFAFRARLRWAARIVNSPVVLFIGLYMVLACFSVAWSPVPDIAARRAGLQIIVILCTVGATYLAPNRKAVLSAASWLFAAVMFVNMAMIARQPPGRLGGYLGIYPDKNILGLVAGLALMFLVYAAVVRRGAARGFFLSTALLALVVLALSNSETSVLLAFAAPTFAAVVIYLASRLRFPVLMVSTFLILAGASAVVSLAILTGTRAEQVLTLVFGDPTFSGRTEIWSFVLNEQRMRPMFGLGYASFWGTGAQSIAFDAAPGFIKGLLQAHSGYLDVMLETGYAGLALLVLTILSAVAQVQGGRRRLGAQEWLVLSVVAFVALHNGLESSWFRSFAAQWVVFLVAVATCLPDSEPRPELQGLQRDVQRPRAGRKAAQAP